MSFKIAIHHGPDCSLRMGFAFICALLLAQIILTTSAKAERVTVFAAASMTNAIDELAKKFQRQGRGTVLTSYASSAALAKQIVNGAPADLFISANTAWMDYAEKNDSIAPGERHDFLSNRLVLVAPVDTALFDGFTLNPGADLGKALGSGKISVGDPDHVPAGIYGRQALEHLGLWKDISGKTIRMPNARSALALAERGEAAAAIVYATDAAISKKVRVIAVFPAESHAPIIYSVAMVAGRKSAAAKAFMDFLRTEEAGRVFSRHGFIPLTRTNRQ
ncbi:MAG: molybdate ABC transporter substrate-binding protein [Rhodospirillales bacterium]|nr:molybdate ABC transporter substrate-binding protein [Rhodospirillales bacterium]MCW8970495.1 molybdate ABC transporter substrate-binding protein [Rhodospirillales bacterium]